MKTAVETIFVGRERAYNRRFLQMCSHYLVDPVACTPASGWRRGRSDQVGLVRERFFTPRLRVKSYEELNAWLLDRCVAYAKAHPHPERRERTVWEMFEAERPSLVRYAGRFDGFHADPASVSKTCLVRFDNNRYSVAANAVGRRVEIRAYADRIELRQGGRVVGEHSLLRSRPDGVRSLALRAGAGPQAWCAEERRAVQGLGAASWPGTDPPKLAGAADSDRQMVNILTAVLSDGLPAVEAACLEALREGVHSADVVINILARRREPAPPITIMTPDALRLRHAPTADCARYDRLRRAI